MTVEALLKQLEDEHTEAMKSVWIYGARYQDAMYYGEKFVADDNKHMHDECYKKALHLSMIIKEIKKRVS